MTCHGHRQHGHTMKVMRFSIICAVALTTIAAPAVAQGGFGALFKMPADGEAEGRYLSNNRIRTYAIADPEDMFDLTAAIREKAALMAQAKQFSNLAIIKQRCATTLFMGIPKATSCYMIANMLRDGETIASKNGDTVEYISVSDVISARAKRYEQRAGIADTLD